MILFVFEKTQQQKRALLGCGEIVHGMLCICIDFSVLSSKYRITHDVGNSQLWSHMTSVIPSCVQSSVVRERDMMCQMLLVCCKLEFPSAWHSDWQFGVVGGQTDSVSVILLHVEMIWVCYVTAVLMLQHCSLLLLLLILLVLLLLIVLYYAQWLYSTVIETWNRYYGFRGYSNPNCVPNPNPNRRFSNVSVLGPLLYNKAVVLMLVYWRPR